MNTAKTIQRGCDRAMLAEVSSGHAAPEVREAFRLQLLAGQSQRLEAAPITSQQNLAGVLPSRAGQQEMF